MTPPWRYCLCVAWENLCSGGLRLVAKQIIHKLVDDLDGGDADETVRFALDGVQYEIDLSKKNAGKLRAALERYTQAGTKIGRGMAAGRRRDGVGGRGRSSASARRDQNRAIREWAQARGVAVSDRGRIKQEIVDQFHAQAGH